VIRHHINSGVSELGLMALQHCIGHMLPFRKKSRNLSAQSEMQKIKIENGGFCYSMSCRQMTSDHSDKLSHIILWYQTNTSLAIVTYRHIMWCYNRVLGSMYISNSKITASPTNHTSICMLWPLSRMTISWLF